MFIAHIPAGYLAASLAARKNENNRKLVATGLFFSVLPDFYLLWFYLVDNRQTAHHEYIFHWPLFWISAALLVWATSRALGKNDIQPYITVALVCLLLHMALDSFAAEIYWLRPFSDVHVNAVEVLPRFEWWVLNFVFHWTFAAEIAICVAAAVLFWRKNIRSDPSSI
jgi:inner membrane protein